MQTSDGPSTAYVDTRLLDVEQELRHTGCRQLYASFVPVIVALAFFPLLKDVSISDGDGGGVRYHYGTLWEMAHTGDGVAGTGVIMFGAVIVLLLRACFSSPHRGERAALVVLTGLIATLLITRPDTPGPTPALTAAGQAGIALMIGLAVLALAHAATDSPR